MKGVARPLLALQEMNMLHETNSLAMASLQARFQTPPGLCLDLSFREKPRGHFSMAAYPQPPPQPYQREAEEEEIMVEDEEDEDETIDVECLSPMSDCLSSPNGMDPGMPRQNGDNSTHDADRSLHLSSPDTEGSDKDGSGRDGVKKMSGDKKLYSCQHCKYVTDRKNNLKRHVVTMHEKCNKMLECCDTVFANKAALRDHVLSCHRNGYDCRICGRNFCRKALLKRHITVHSGQKDYVCGVCGYATSHKSNLDRHKRRHGPKIPGLGIADDTSLHRAPKSLHAHMDHFNRAFFSYIIPNDIYTQPYGENALPRFNRTPRNKYTHGKYMFTKRLLCTYESLLNKDHVDFPVRHREDLFCNHNHKIHNHCVKTENFSQTSSEKHYTQQPLVKRLLQRTRSPVSTKRLFPALYRCKSCDVVFDKQLQLTEHYEAQHSHKNCPRVPQRPLTLQARPRDRDRDRDRGWHVSG